jgi:hypothetical protein
MRGRGKEFAPSSVDYPRETDALVKNVDEPGCLEALHLETRDLDLEA